MAVIAVQFALRRFQANRYDGQAKWKFRTMWSAENEDKTCWLYLWESPAPEVSAGRD